MKQLLILIILAFSINLSAQHVVPTKHSYKTMGSVMNAKFKEIPKSTKIGFSTFVAGVLVSRLNFKGGSTISRGMMLSGAALVTFDIVTRKKKKEPSKSFVFN